MGNESNLSVINQRKNAVDEEIRLDERALDSIKGIGDLDSIQARILAIEEDIRHLEVQETNIRQQMKDLLRSEELSKRYIGEWLTRGISSPHRACRQESNSWDIVGRCSSTDFSWESASAARN